MNLNTRAIPSPCRWAVPLQPLARASSPPWPSLMLLVAPGRATARRYTAIPLRGHGVWSSCAAGPSPISVDEVDCRPTTGGRQRFVFVFGCVYLVDTPGEQWWQDRWVILLLNLLVWIFYWICSTFCWRSFLFDSHPPAGRPTNSGLPATDAFG